MRRSLPENCTAPYNRIASFLPFTNSSIQPVFFIKERWRTREKGRKLVLQSWYLKGPNRSLSERNQLNAVGLLLLKRAVSLENYPFRSGGIISDHLFFGSVFGDRKARRPFGSILRLL